MTSYHHPYSSTQATGWGAMQPYRSRPTDFWYKLAWLSVGVLALLGSAFSLYRNGVLLKFARDWGVEQAYLSFERSLLGGPYWGTPSFELPMPSVAGLASSQFALKSALAAERVIPSEAAARTTPLPRPTTEPSAEPTAIGAGTQDQDDESSVGRGTQKHESLVGREKQDDDSPIRRGAPAAHDPSLSRTSQRSFNEPKKLSKSETATPAPSRPSISKAESASNKSSVAIAVQKEPASSKSRSEVSASQESGTSKSSGEATVRVSASQESGTSKSSGEATVKRVPEPKAVARATESSPAPVSKPAPARKENPLDAAIRAAIGK